MLWILQTVDAIALDVVSTGLFMLVPSVLFAVTQSAAISTSRNIAIRKSKCLSLRPAIRSVSARLKIGHEPMPSLPKNKGWRGLLDADLRTDEAISV